LLYPRSYFKNCENSKCVCHHVVIHWRVSDFIRLSGNPFFVMIVLFFREIIKHVMFLPKIQWQTIHNYGVKIRLCCIFSYNIKCENWTLIWLLYPRSYFKNCENSKCVCHHVSPNWKWIWLYYTVLYYSTLLDIQQRRIFTP
jgi:hypothetical protein